MAHTIDTSTDPFDHIRSFYLGRVFLSLHALRLVGEEELLSISPFNDALFELLYAGVVTGIEEYLQDRLHKEVFKDDYTIQRYIDKYNDNNKKTKSNKAKLELSVDLPLSDAGKDKIEETLYSKQVYHRLDILRGYFMNVSNVDIFDNQIGKKIKAIVETRHKIIHHGSKEKDGSRIKIDIAEVQRVYDLATSYIYGMEELFIKEGHGILMERPDEK